MFSQNNVQLEQSHGRNIMTKFLECLGLCMHLILHKQNNVHLNLSQNKSN